MGLGDLLFEWLYFLINKEENWETKNWRSRQGYNWQTHQQKTKNSIWGFYVIHYNSDMHNNAFAIKQKENYCSAAVLQKKNKHYLNIQFM